jgi:hypothetical protein
VDHQRSGGALQQRAPEFLPFNRPILAGVEKSHQSGPGLASPVSMAVPKSPTHGFESNQAHRFSIELSHLTEHVGLLHALEDQAVIEVNVRPMRFL